MKTLKKTLAILFVLGMILSLSSCGRTSAEPAAVGGWKLTENGAITNEAQAALDKALDGLVGVRYVPVALLGTQLVSGTNYCILCEATVVYPDAKPYYAIVTVYADLQGGAELRNIVALDLGAIEESGKVEDATQQGEVLLGGWALDRESKVGVDGAVLHLGSKLVSGTMHCVLCKGWELKFVYEDLAGKTELKQSVELDLDSLSQPKVED